MSPYSLNRMQEALQASLLTFSIESASPSAGVDDTGAEDDTEFLAAPADEWSCGACTYVNSNGASCAMCGTARNGQDVGGSESEDQSSNAASSLQSF